MVDLQCCIHFRRPAKWISYTYTHFHSFLDSLFPYKAIIEYWIVFPVTYFIYSGAYGPYPWHFLFSHPILWLKPTLFSFPTWPGQPRTPVTWITASAAALRLVAWPPALPQPQALPPWLPAAWSVEVQKQARRMQSQHAETNSFCTLGMDRPYNESKAFPFTTASKRIKQINLTEL